MPSNHTSIDIDFIPPTRKAKEPLPPAAVGHCPRRFYDLIFFITEP